MEGVQDPRTRVREVDRVERNFREPYYRWRHPDISRYSPDVRLHIYLTSNSLLC